MIEHKVVEMTRVTDDELTDKLNEMQATNWTLDRVDYVKDTGVRRPQMAYLYFSRTLPDND